jgi:hypothetical protein
MLHCTQLPLTFPSLQKHDSSNLWERQKGPLKQLTWIHPEVGIYEPLVISIDGPGHTRPGLGDAQGPGDIAALHNVALQTQGGTRESGQVLGERQRAVKQHCPPNCLD